MSSKIAFEKSLILELRLHELVTLFFSSNCFFRFISATIIIWKALDSLSTGYVSIGINSDISVLKHSPPFSIVMDSVAFLKEVSFKQCSEFTSVAWYCKGLSN